MIFGGTISEGSEIVVKPENASSVSTLESFRGKKVGCYRMETGHMVMKGLLREIGFDLHNWQIRLREEHAAQTACRVALSGIGSR